MKILLDESAPHVIKKRLPERAIQTVAGDGMGRGEEWRITQVLVVSAMIPAIEQALQAIQIGDFVELPFPVPE